MERYCYVNLCNPVFYTTEDGRSVRTETSKEIEKIGGMVSLGYSEPSELAIFGVRETVKQRKQKFFGIEYNEKYIAYDSQFVICIDKGNCLEDIITGKSFQKVDRYEQKPSINVKLSVGGWLASNQVAAILKQLKPADVQRYAVGLNNFEQAIRNGYYKDCARIQKELQEKQNNDAYIRNFRNRYGK
jgi:GH18 family chitinase